MHFPTVFATTLAVTGLVSAHSEGGIPGAPKIFGRRTVHDLKARGIIGDAKRAAGLEESSNAAAKRAGPQLDPRQVGGTSGQCGPGVGSCASGYCCSSAGWCGTGTDYCAAPDCQFNYGSGCDANKIPPGASTSTVTRTKVNNGILYGGAGIYDCVEPNMIALTYDDGPYIYTAQILDVLKAFNVPATFFITGNNLGKGEIDNSAYPWVNIIQRMHNEGHQIASHTWSHQDLGSNAAVQNQDVLTKQQRLNQMYYNEMALRNILGFFPTYMRPPYSDCDSASGCESDLATLGYHIIYFDLDTEDYLNDAPNMIQTSKNDFSGNLSTSNPATDNWLVISHDIHQQTAYNLTQYMIQYALAQGWTFGTVGQCLGDPAANWYRSSSGSTFSSGTASLPANTWTISGPTGLSTSSTPSSTKASTTTTTSSGTSTKTSSSVTTSSATTSKTSSSTTTSSATSSKTSTSTKTSSSTGTKTSSSTSTGSKTSSSTGTQPTNVSTDGSCGGTNGFTCTGSTFGTCCSQYGWCGSTSAYCGTGCNAAFGTCTSGSSSAASGSSSKSSSTSSKPSTSTSASAPASTDGSCGGTGGFTCTGSTFGTCCSQYGWCGSTSAYCGTGCQAAWGTCT